MWDRSTLYVVAHELRIPDPRLFGSGFGKARPNMTVNVVYVTYEGCLPVSNKKKRGCLHIVHVIHT